MAGERKGELQRGQRRAVRWKRKNKATEPLPLPESRIAGDLCPLRGTKEPNMTSFVWTVRKGRKE